MSEILFHYQKVNPTTWAYLSSLLMIGLFFQFNRFWSVRNLDLVLLILLPPGLLMVNQAREAAGANSPAGAGLAAAAPAPTLALSPDSIGADPNSEPPGEAAAPAAATWAGAPRQMARNGY